MVRDKRVEGRGGQPLPRMSLVHIGDGDSTRHLGSLCHQLTLKRLGCGERPLGAEPEA